MGKKMNLLEIAAQRQLEIDLADQEASSKTRSAKPRMSLSERLKRVHKSSDETYSEESVSAVQTIENSNSEHSENLCETSKLDHITRSESDLVKNKLDQKSDLVTKLDQNVIQFSDLVNPESDLVTVLGNEDQTPVEKKTYGAAKNIILDHLSKNLFVVGTQGNIAKSLNIPIASFKRAVKSLSSVGLISQETKEGRGGHVAIRINKLIEPQDSAPKLDQNVIQYSDICCIKNIKDNKGKEVFDGTSEVLEKFSKISKESFTERYPCLTSAGFSLKSIKRILKIRTENGEPVDGIPDGLDHLEWTLEYGELKDSHGVAVKNASAFIYTHLLKSGYFKRPNDQRYVSPAEQREIDRLSENKSILEIRKTLEDVEFDSWRMSLDSSEEKYFLENSGMNLLDKFAKSKRYVDLALKAAFRRLKNGEITYFQADGSPGSN